MKVTKVGRWLGRDTLMEGDCEMKQGCPRSQRGACVSIRLDPRAEHLLISIVGVWVSLFRFPRRSYFTLFYTSGACFYCKKNGRKRQFESD
jgi:hypothetical protein